MRVAAGLFALCCAATTALADDGETDRARDGVRVGAALGAGGQGTATYGALELGIDVLWRDVRVGLGARGVWLDGAFRRADWSRGVDAVRVLRHLEARTEHLALAAGALAPSQLGHVADGYRAALDDRLRTGFRGAVTTERLQLGLEIDDVLDPALVGGAARWQLDGPWALHAAAAVDPGLDPDVDLGAGAIAARSALELGGSRFWEGTRRRIELGAALVGEPTDGVGVVGFGRADLEHAGARYTGVVELRAGTGTTGAAFGPLHRLERRGLLDDARTGVGAAVSLGVAAPAGWITASVRARPGLGPLVAASAGAPAGRYLQAAGWIAASRDAAAGAAELRVAWARRLSSALQVARMYATDEMQPAPVWSLTAWFGATTD